MTRAGFELVKHPECRRFIEFLYKTEIESERASILTEAQAQVNHRSSEQDFRRALVYGIRSRVDAYLRGVVIDLAKTIITEHERQIQSMRLETREAT